MKVSIKVKVFQKQPIDQLLIPMSFQENKVLLRKKKAFHLAGLDDATKEPPLCDLEKFAA